jgi:hypothetical protein
MVDYDKDDLNSLLEYLESMGWWASRSDSGRQGNTKLMRALKYYCQSPEECKTQVSRAAPEEYRFIFEIPLDDLPLEINNQKMHDIVRWRLEKGK